MSSSECISPTSTEVISWAIMLPQKLKRVAQPKKTFPKGDDLLVFDILNIFRRCWFLSRDHLLTNVISAQKAEDGKFSWVEFTPQYHSHLVKCAVALVPHPALKVKKVMFAYILELLDGDGNKAFFKLQKGGHKANNAQKEKRHLAQKRSCASKREREWEAVKVAKQPPCERQYRACGHKFNSHKIASKHKCPNSKVERMRKEAASGEASQSRPTAMEDTPPATPTPHAPSTPTNSDVIPAVTGASQEHSSPYLVPMVHPRTGLQRLIHRDKVERSLVTGWKHLE